MGIAWKGAHKELIPCILSLLCIQKNRSFLMLVLRVRCLHPNAQEGKAELGGLAAAGGAVVAWSAVDGPEDQSAGEE